MLFRRKAAAGGTIVLSLALGGWLWGQPTPPRRPSPSPAPPAARGTTPRPSTVSSATAPATTAPAAAAATAPKAMPINIGQKVEVKKGGSWHEALVKNKGNGWILVHYQPGTFHEWVAPWRIRAVGSSEDNLPFVMPGDTLFKPGPPPTQKPPAAPDADDRVALSPREGRPAPGAGQGRVGRPERPGLNHGVLDELSALPVKPTDLTAVATVTLDAAAGATVAPDPAEAAKPAAAAAGKAVQLSGALGDFFDRVDGMRFAAPSLHQAVIVHSNSGSRVPRAVQRVERVDLAAGRSLGTVQLPVPVKVFDVSRDGRFLLTASRQGDSTYENRVDVWQLDARAATSAPAATVPTAAGPTPAGRPPAGRPIAPAGNPAPVAGVPPAPKHVVGFVPYAGGKSVFETTVGWAVFISPTLLATANDDSVTVWDFANARAVWTVKVAKVTPALSPGGKQLAVATKQDVHLLDAATGKPLATLATGEMLWGMLSFRPDGKQLSAGSWERTRVWDLASGKPVAEVPLNGATTDELAWPADGYLLEKGQNLYALSKQVLLWTYARGDSVGNARGLFGGRYWYVAKPTRAGGNEAQPILTSVVIPEPAAVAMASKIPADFFIVKPGTKVSLEIGNVAGDPQKVRDELTRKLTANGLVVADGQPIKLAATQENGETVEMRYESFGGIGRGGESTLSVTELVSRLTLSGADGVVLWERKGVTRPPHMLSLKKDQTIEQAVAEAMKPSGDFFLTTVVPKFVPDPKYKNGLGSSSFTAKGLEAWK